MFSPVASAIFTYRNTDKAQNGEVGRGTVAAAQLAGLVQEGAKSTSAIGNITRSTLSVGSKLAKQYKVFDYASKVTKFAADNVNPLICVSGAIKTLRSDDKMKTGITETTALTTMFAGEALTKHYYDKIIGSKACKDLLTKASSTKYLKPVFEYLEKHNLTGKVGAIVKGLAFVAASITAYNIGHKMGEDINDRLKANLNIKAQTPKENTPKEDSVQKVTPKKIDQKA